MALSASGINLIVARLDLKLVQVIRAAINPAGGRATPLGPAADSSPATRPTDRFEPRRVFHPTPRYEPRPILHLAPRPDTGPVLCPATRFAPGDADPATTPPASNITPGPIEPVWKHLPPLDSTRSAHGKPPVVNVVKPAPVISYKGTLLDFFV